MSYSATTRWAARARKLLARLSGRTRIERFGAAVEGGADPHGREALRVMYVANSFIPTLQLSFVKPLQQLVDAGEVQAELLSEQQMKELFGKAVRADTARDWALERIERFRPNVLLFCRYSGPHVEALLDFADRHGIATVFHIDDDLLNVPPEIGQAKYEFHNHPMRLGAVRALLSRADLVYCSTEPLRERLRQHADDRAVTGHIYCSGEVLAPPMRREPSTIGYMGFDHAHDFQIALPALVRVLDKHPQLRFELFGSIPKPAQLERFGDRIGIIPPVPDYQQFMAKFASLGWAVGICPLADTPFNAVKANTKWVEYTAIGAAVVATGGTIYDGCCADGCGRLVHGDEAWFLALDELASDATARESMVAAAQQRLASEYSVYALREQVMGMFDLAHTRRRAVAVTA